MKRILSLLLVIAMALSLVACGGSAAPAAEASADVAMQYITPEDAKGLLEDSGYVFFDIRKAADSGASTIPGAEAWDMDAAKEGDAEAGKATMTKATEGLDKKIILVCYSGKRYAQAATNALSAIGYDMSKVYTLEGGFTAWSEKFPDLTVAPEDAAPAETEAAPTETAAPAKEVETKSGVVTFELDMTQYEQGKVVRAWVPVAQGNEYQTVTDVSFNADGAKAELTTDSQGNKMLYVEWAADAAAESRKASVSFHVVHQEVIRPELVENGTVGAELDEYLQPTSTIPVTGAVKDLADEITAGETTVLGKARAIYDWIVANMNRDNDVIGCGTGDVCVLLDTKAGKCTDINSVFVGLCRAAGIPAREMFGVRINADVITKNQHCWAEFYLPGTGWVAADPADVLKAVLTNSWDKSAPETLEKQEFYWGGSEAARLELSRGRDIVLNPAQAGEPLNNFGYPYAEVDGEAVDFYSPDSFAYAILFAED